MSQEKSSRPCGGEGCPTSLGSTSPGRTRSSVKKQTDHAKKQFPRARVVYRGSLVWSSLAFERLLRECFAISPAEIKCALNGRRICVVPAANGDWFGGLHIVDPLPLGNAIELAGQEDEHALAITESGDRYVVGEPAVEYRLSVS